MAWIDWTLVIVINVSIAGYGLMLARGTGTTKDWFLAARGLPWWVVGLSAFATAADSGDYVVVAGSSYIFGISPLTQWWLGLTLGWFLVSYFIYIPMYRTGMFTNAEWLEYRFGPTARLLSVIIQIQHRTNVLGNIAWSLFLTLRVVGGLSEFWSWATVVLIAMVAAWYSAQGGLKSVAITDVLQYVTMAVASILLWFVVWQTLGGRSAVQQKLAEQDRLWMLHVGGYEQPGVPAPLVAYGWIVLLIAYGLVNHSQSIRFLGARSEWDMKMGALVAAGATAVVMWFNMTLGVLGRAQFPDLEVVDNVFPLLVRDFLTPGLIGLVVAGILGAGMSTYDSISNAISALFTRDVYARFLKRDGSDEHYLRVSRLTVPIIIALGFLYVPFLKVGAVKVYLSLTSIFVLPLAVLYLVGAFTKVHRSAAVVGLSVGAVYGLFAFSARTLEWQHPSWLIDVWWGYLWNVLLPATSMIVYSAILDQVRGPMKEADLAGLTYPTRDLLPEDVHAVAVSRLQAAEADWLERSRMEVQRGPVYPFPVTSEGLPWYRRDKLLVWTFILLMLFLNLVVLW